MQATPMISTPAAPDGWTDADLRMAWHPQGAATMREVVQLGLRKSDLASVVALPASFDEADMPVMAFRSDSGLISVGARGAI